MLKMLSTQELEQVAGGVYEGWSLKDILASLRKKGVKEFSKTTDSLPDTLGNVIFIGASGDGKGFVYLNPAEPAGNNLYSCALPPRGAVLYGLREIINSENNKGF